VFSRAPEWVVVGRLGGGPGDQGVRSRGDLCERAIEGIRGWVVRVPNRERGVRAALSLTVRLMAGSSSVQIRLGPPPPPFEEGAHHRRIRSGALGRPERLRAGDSPCRSEGHELLAGRRFGRRTVAAIRGYESLGTEPDRERRAPRRTRPGSGTLEEVGRNRLRSMGFDARPRSRDGAIRAPAECCGSRGRCCRGRTPVSHGRGERDSRPQTMPASARAFDPSGSWRTHLP
jgi:hypothetical protein